MPWIYRQRSGALIEPNGTVIAHGYSGKGIHKNRPESEHLKREGPIPRARWTVVDLEERTVTHGPFVLRLDTADPIHGRDGFLIHGDNPDHTASEGCIILSRDIREAIWDSRDRILNVVE